MQNVCIRNKDSSLSNRKIRFWLPVVHTEILFNSIFQKLIQFIGSEEATALETLINNKNPFKHLNYASEEVYLISHNLNKAKVVKNSILHVFNDSDKEDLEVLTEYFMPLVMTKKVKVFNAKKETEKAIYAEIISYLEYVIKIKNLLFKNQDENSGDQFGTGFRKSSLKKIVDIQINTLKKRLINSHFILISEDEINRTNSLLKMLEKSQEDNYKNLFEYLHIGNQLVGLNIGVLGLNQDEVKMYSQILNFYNGIKCSDIELVRSSMIYLNILFNHKNNDVTEYSELILDITMHFFNDEMVQINHEKNILTFNESHIQKPYALKTTLDTLHVYKYSNQTSPIEELMEIALHSMVGANNKFEPELPPIEELSDYTIVKNVLSLLKKEIGFDKEDIRVLVYFLSLIEKGKIPSPQFV